MVQIIKIDRAAYEDMEAILALQKIAFMSEAELYNDFNIEPLTQTLESIQSDYDSYIFLKAEYDNRIIGSVKAKETNGQCWVGKLIVHHEFQNQGIGKRLLLEVENLFPLAEQYFLFTGHKSIKNICLYESSGYVRYEEFNDDKNPGVTLIKMVKTAK